MTESTPYPIAVDPLKVGSYPARAASGGGLVWDAVLEYRVWCHPPGGDDDSFRAFATYDEALAFASSTPGTEDPVALVRQDEHIDEPEPGKFIHVKTPRTTEWPVEFLRRPRRTSHTIPDFLSPTAPANRLEILRGVAR